MSFKDISFGMFKSDIKKYILYFLCNSFIVMLLFLYLTLYTNTDFNNPLKVDPMISSNVKAPTIVLLIFSFCFIIYFHNYFIKFRKKDLSIFIILGMKTYDIIKIIFSENLLMSVSSCITGLLTGTIFAKLFYIIILKIIDLNIDFSINLKSYIYSSSFFMGINLIIIIKNCITIPRCEIIKLLKSQRAADNNLFGKRVFGIIGICLIAFQVINLIFLKSFHYSIFILNMVNIMSIYLILSNLHSIISRFRKLFKPSNTITQPIWISNLKYSIGSGKKLIFSISLLITVIVYLASFCATCSDITTKNVFIKNPYNISYVEIYGKNKISQDKLDSIVNHSDTQIQTIKSFEIIDEKPVIIVSDKDINKTVNTNFKVKKGCYICLMQINRKDGYSHNEQPIETYNINGQTYKIQESIEKFLFNNNTFLNNSYYLIFNNEEYKEIRAEINKDNIGSIKLLQFHDWTKTKSVFDTLTEELKKYNDENSVQFFENYDYDLMQFKPSSKINDYMIANESNNFTVFIFFFVYFLFFISSNLMIHFRLLTEFKSEKIKYDKLYKIGFSTKELSSNISKELAVFFITPCMSGIYIGVYWIYIKLSSIGIDNLYTIKNSFISGITYLLLEIIYYLIYKKYYLNKLLFK